MTITWNSFRSKLKGKGYTLEQLSKMYKKASKKGSKKASNKASKKASKKPSKKASKKPSKKASKKPSKKPSQAPKASIQPSRALKASIQPSQAGKKPSKPPVKHTPVNHTGQIYRVHDNGGRPFLVVFVNTTVQIYKIPKKVRDNWDWDKESPKNEDYSELVKSYTIVKSFIGKSPKTKGTEFSGGYGPKFDGNSILLQLSSDRYVFIGWDIYEFTFPEQIVEYTSPVGNSDVPYPVAISTNYAIFMNDKVYLPKNDFPSHTNWKDPYVDFYALTMKNFDKNRKDKLLKPKKLKTKMIHKRIF